MKKLLGTMLLGIAALAVPFTLLSTTGCSSDVGKSEQIEGVEAEQPEGHEADFESEMSDEDLSQDM